MILATEQYSTWDDGDVDDDDDDNDVNGFLTRLVVTLMSQKMQKVSSIVA